MIASCATCSRMFETTEEDACTPGVLCPDCYRYARDVQAAYSARRPAPVAVDLPPSADPVWAAAQLAAGAPEVRRETVRAGRVLPTPPVLCIDRGLVTVLVPELPGPAVELPEAEAARRLLAFPALLAALEEVEPLLARLGSQGGLAAVRAALAAARP